VSADKRRPSSDRQRQLQSLRQQAIRLARTRRVDRLASVCNGILRLDSGDVHARYLLGMCLRYSGEPGEASTHLVAAAECAPENPLYILAAAEIMYELGAHYRSIDLLRHFLGLHPGSALAYSRLATAYCATGRLSEAIGPFRKALRIDSSHLDSLINLGNALQELGRKRAAAACYKRAIAVAPDCAEAYYNLHAAVYHEDNPDAAIAALRGALRANARHGEARAYLAMLLDQSGRTAAAGRLFRELHSLAPALAFLEESWDYIRGNRTRNTRLFSVTFDALRHAFARSRGGGLVMEFGVRHGTSINFLALQTRDTVHGFDSFEGLPENWKGVGKGLYSTMRNPPRVRSNVQLHPGWFKDTLPAFRARNPATVRFMNIDCDLYSSTHTVFEYLHDRLAPGSVIVFDEYLANPDWRRDEYRAFQEFVQARKLRYEYLLFSPFSKQAAVVIR
jgi:tetratricopeptide (TPR) repeat protein